jgi:tRNA threonylcarbamoyladenosine biosynthesis protein TsaB
MTATLGFDTATADTAVAATRDGNVVSEAVRGPAAPGGRPVHVTVLVAEIEAAAAALGGWPAVDRLAVGVGPGSFTGVRHGVATARGLAQGLDLELVGVSTLAALAAAMRRARPGPPQLAVVDARRGELFAALYDDAGDEKWPPFAARPEELAERLAGLSESPLAAGDGSLRFRVILEAAGAVVPPDSDPVHRVSASFICGLAQGEGVGEDPVEPLYLRRPDAELWREQQAKQQKAGNEQA